MEGLGSMQRIWFMKGLQKIKGVGGSNRNTSILERNILFGDGEQMMSVGKLAEYMRPKPQGALENNGLCSSISKGVLDIW